MERSIYEHIGGHEKLTPLVNDFYQRVMKDESLQHFFANVDMDKQREHQANFLSMAMGGPNQYTGRAMAEAHKGLNSTHAHFDAILGHLHETMKQHELEDHHIDHVIQHVSGYRGHIVQD